MLRERLLAAVPEPVISTNDAGGYITVDSLKSKDPDAPEVPRSADRCIPLYTNWPPGEKFKTGKKNWLVFAGLG